MLSPFRIVRAAIALSAFLAAAPLAAQYQGGMIPDPSFGSNGFGALPQLDPTQTVIAPIGFVRLTLTDGYVYFHVQQIGANSRVVATRFNNNGTIDTEWGNNGSLIYAIPVPAYASPGDPLGLEARLGIVVEEVPATAGPDGNPIMDVIYLVARMTTDTNYLYVARFEDSGAFLSFTTSNLSAHFVGGAGSITALAMRQALSKAPEAIVAVRGGGAETNKTAVVPVRRDMILDGPGSSLSLTRPDLRINQLIYPDDNYIDALGTASGMAMYAQYDPSGNAWVTERSFHFSCQSGTPTGSVADGLLRPASLGADVLIVGRHVCTDTPVYSALARVANIATAPSVAWTVRTSSDAAGCSNLTDVCVYSFAAVSSSIPDRAYVAGNSRLAQVDIGSQPGRLVGSDALFTAVPGVTRLVTPSFRYGADEVYPQLVGFGMVADSSGLDMGFGRIFVDRIFADGVEL